MTTMNTTNATATMTQANALRWLIDHATDAPVEVIEAAEKLYTAKTKVYDRVKTVSKERRENEMLVDEFVALIENGCNAGELVNTKYLATVCNNPAVRSPQKARAVVDIAIDRGLVEKYTEKGRTYYKLVA